MTHPSQEEEARRTTGGRTGKHQTPGWSGGSSEGLDSGRNRKDKYTGSGLASLNNFSGLWGKGAILYLALGVSSGQAYRSQEGHSPVDWGSGLWIGEVIFDK